MQQAKAAVTLENCHYQDMWRLMQEAEQERRQLSINKLLFRESQVVARGLSEYFDGISPTHIPTEICIKAVEHQDNLWSQVAVARGKKRAYITFKDLTIVELVGEKGELSRKEFITPGAALIYTANSI